MDRPEFTIAVTGLNAIDNPGPGVGVIRAIRECSDFDVRIVGLAYESLEPGAYLHDIVDKTYQIPYPSAGSDQLKNRLLYLNTIEDFDVVIPNFDAELRNFIKLENILRQNGIASFLPPLELLDQVHKMNLSQFCEKHGILTPKTAYIHQVAEIDDLEDEFDFPVYVKGTFYEAYQAGNPDQVKTYFNKLSAKWGLPVIIQENVNGTEIVVAGLADGTGRLTGAIPLRKLFITDRGKGWSGVVLEDDQLIETTKKFTEASKWKGGFELEFIRNDDDELILLEVNPRFPAWVYTTAAAGQNLPAALVKMALGQPVTPFSEYKVGKMFVRYAWELITDIEEFQKFSVQGEL